MVRKAFTSLPRCIHLAGADGTGKTTQAKEIVKGLRGQGISVRYLWLRFPRLTCIPFLIYARIRGYSYYKMTNGQQHGYWNFADSWIMSNLFPWFLWFDTFITALYKVYLPIKMGDVTVCDRFVVDVLVDLMTGLNDANFDERVPGRLFLALLPRDTQVMIFDLETAVAQERCPELEGDHSHSQRRAIYLTIAHKHSWPIIHTNAPITTITDQILQTVTHAPPSRQTEKMSRYGGKNQQPTS